MLKIDVRSNLKQVIQQIEGIRRDQLPFATALALTQTAIHVKRAEITEMQSVFDRPTPYTLGALFNKPATKQSLEAKVWIKSKFDAGKGNAPENFLLPEIEGGPRRMKRFELALQRIGVMPTGYQAVPGEEAPLDAYGNIPGPEIVRILSYLQAFGEQGYRANITEKRREALKKGTRTAYGYALFVVYPGRGGRGSHLHPGIWKRVYTGFGQAIVPLIMYVKPATYQKRFKFWEVAERTIAREFPREFEAAAMRALATARPA